MKEGLPLPVAASVVADVAHHRVETLIGLQKQLLDAAAEETHALAESSRRKRVAGRRACSGSGTAWPRGFIASEKKFLDLAAKEVTRSDQREQAEREAAGDR